MIDLDREMRALLEADARGTPPLADAGPVLRRARRRQAVVALGAVAIAFALVAGSVAGVSALVRSSDRIVIGPDGSSTPSVCPPASTPEGPGSTASARPSTDDHAYAQTVFDPASGRIVMITAAGDMWTLDVCTNTWAPAPRSLSLEGVRELVAVADSRRLVALQAGANGWRTWTLDADADTWEEQGRPPLSSEAGFIQGPEAVFEPATGHVIVWEGAISAMWDYDADADTWEAIPMKGALPPTLDPALGWDVGLMTYDTTAGRLILYVGGESGSQTWEFDLRGGRWTDRRVDTPATGFGWVPSGDETAFDEANEVTVLSSGGTTATYDASAGTWTVLAGGDGIEHAPDARTTRLYFAMAYDPLNARIVVAGGEVKTNDRWRPTDDVIALDAATGRWVELVAPSADPMAMREGP
jgi:hypothetical protein